MNRYLLLHYGLEKPTPEIMEAWGAWFASIAESMVDQGGFSGGRQISHSGTRELPWDLDCITGYNVIAAEDFDSAEKIASTCPFISSIRICELRPAQAWAKRGSNKHTATDGRAAGPRTARHHHALH